MRKKDSWILSSVLTASLLRLVTDKRSDTVRVESLNNIQLRLAVQFQFSEHGHSGVARNSFRGANFGDLGDFRPLVQWGPLAKPRWGLGAKPPEADDFVIIMYIDF